MCLCRCCTSTSRHGIPAHSPACWGHPRVGQSPWSASRLPGHPCRPRRRAAAPSRETMPHRAPPSPPPSPLYSPSFITLIAPAHWAASASPPCIPVYDPWVTHAAPGLHWLASRASTSLSRCHSPRPSSACHSATPLPADQKTKTYDRR